MSNAYGNTEYYKCQEKITNVLKGESQSIKVGKILGENYVKFSSLNSSFPIVTIKFKESGGKKSTRKIITEKKLNVNSLGYDIYNKLSKDNSNIENTYNFIKIKNTYAFTRKEFYWSVEDQSLNKTNYEYEASGRCVKINKKDFISEKKIALVKKENKKITKKTKSSKSLSGERSFAMSWDGYDDLILGKIRFLENDLVGKFEFSLPNNDGICIGTYALSTKKGTWSTYCEKQDVNASGSLKWDNIDGSVEGKGMDNKGKRLKFKVSSQN